MRAWSGYFSLTLTGSGHQLAELHVVVGEVLLEEVHVGLPGHVDWPHHPAQPVCQQSGVLQGQRVISRHCGRGGILRMNRLWVINYYNRSFQCMEANLFETGKGKKWCKIKKGWHS